MLKNNGSYKKAAASFKDFTRIYKNRDSFLYQKAIQEIKSCDFAERALLTTVPVKVSHLPPPINSAEADFASVMYSDSVLVFSSLRAEETVEIKGKAKVNIHVNLYNSKGKDTIWNNVQEVAGIINKAGYHVANGAFNADRTVFYFSVCS